MRFVFDDSGRTAAGYKGIAGDCACRALAIAAEMPYQRAYDLINQFAVNKRKGSHKRRISSARTGVHRATMRRVMNSLNWKWMPTMGIGTGCRVHLHDGELPAGRLIVAVSKHYVAVIDGIIHDIADPQRETHVIDIADHGQPLKPGQTRNINGICLIQRRCVYGYWSKST